MQLLIFLLAAVSAEPAQSEGSAYSRVYTRVYTSDDTGDAQAYCQATFPTIETYTSEVNSQRHS